MSKTLSDHGFPPLSSFRLIVPPLQLVSAALLEIVKQGAVMYFGLLEEFITSVLETAPELLTDTERVQLVIGLRAKAVLELCRNDAFSDQQAFQHHLSQINTFITNQDKETSNSEMKVSVTNFLRLVHTLMEDHCQRDIFYKNIFPTLFGPKYDSALQALMKKFLLNLHELLPVPNLEQTSLWLSLSPSILKECVDFMNQSKPLKTLIQHHKHHGHKVPKALSSSGDDCILSSLSYHLPNVDKDKGDVVVKTEPTFDPDDWQADNLLSSESKQVEEDDVNVFYSEFVKNEEEYGQQCVSDVTEDQGASVEVTVPFFEENESSDGDHMDEKWFNHLGTCSRTSNEDGSLDEHQRMRAGRSKGQEEMDPHCSSSSAFHTEPLPIDKFNKSVPFDMSNIAPQELISSDTSQEQTSKRSSRVKQCSICREIFTSSTDLMKHMRSHTEHSPYLCCYCGEDFDSYKDCMSHQKDKCKASNQSSKDSSMSHENNMKQEINEVYSEISQSSTTADASADSKAYKQPLTCPKCCQRFTYHKSFEKHQKICSEAASRKIKKTNTINLINNRCDIISVDKAMESTSSAAVASSEISQSSTTEDASADSNAYKQPQTCPKCGQCFTYYKSFEKHQKTCLEAAPQTKEPTNTNYLIINGCDFFSVDNTNEINAEKSSETMESQTATSSTADDAEGSQCKDGTFKCTMCEKDFSNIVLMQRHYSESHDFRGPYPCTLCKTTFTRLAELVHHQQNKQLFQCPTCKKGLRTPEEIKKHKKVHTPTPCKCETCGKCFKSHYPLMRHRRTHREQPPVVCTYCGKQFASKNYLKAHMVRHTGGYPCPECGKVFYQKTYLTYHLYKHKGQEPYLCETCGKGWPNAALLKVHMVKHREDRPFKCEDCGATYKRESHLMAHRRSKHLGLRPFVCEVCSKAFRLNNELKNHMKVHTGERPFSCPVCGKHFTQAYSLKKHREKPCM
ncbi:zinc finger protein 665-like isoform X1 [Labrus mixtus]|uniref:zinc finger protein 665-like isoform X1 n=2 Tax=Labrus mixtus TaxID=508554 RepID=UPI0029C0AA0E|nr:zinc finger protein 665-like isoform X1 [Labrus mixtus]